MPLKVHGPGRSGPHKKNSPIDRIAARMRNIISQQQLMKPSEYQCTTSNCVVLGKKIFVHKDHHYALVYWAKAIKELGMKRKAILIHVDRHPDLEGDYPTIKSDPTADQLFERAKEIAKELDNFPDVLPEEKFIRPAVSLGIIAKCIFVPTFEEAIYAVELDAPLEAVPLEKLARERVPDPEHDYILDIDLDYFRKDEDLDKRLKHLAALIKAYKPKVTTIAFSPASSNLYRPYLEIDLESCCKVIAEVAHASGLDENSSMEVIPEDRRTMRWSPK